MHCHLVHIDNDTCGMGRTVGGIGESHIQHGRNVGRYCNSGTGTVVWLVHVTNRPEDGRVAVATREHQFSLFVCWSTLADKFAGSITSCLLAFHKILNSCPRYIRDRHCIKRPRINPPPFCPHLGCPRNICMHESAYVWSLNQTLDPVKLCLVDLPVHSLV